MTTGTVEQQTEEQFDQKIEEEAGSAESEATTRALERSTFTLGIAPAQVEAAWRFAQMLARSTLVPKQFQGRPEDVIVAMQHGVEVGLPPMAALQSIAVINGRPGLWGDGLLGVVISHRAYGRHEEYYLVGGDRKSAATVKDLERDDTTAVSKFWRKGSTEPAGVSEFSVGDAKKAGLWTKEGPWRNYPARMLKMRARSFAARDAFPDALRGMKAVEELLDTPADIVVETVDNTPPAEPVRRSEKAAAQTPTVEPEPQPTNDAAPAQPGSDNGAKGSAEKPAEPTATAGPGQVTKNVRIDNTQIIDLRQKGGQLTYEISGIVYDKGKAGLGHTWFTTDEQLYRMAASCEGSDTLLTVTWHTAKAKTGGKTIRVITGLEAAN